MFGDEGLLRGELLKCGSRVGPNAKTVAFIREIMAQMCPEGKLSEWKKDTCKAEE